MIHLPTSRTLPGATATPSTRTQAVFNCIRYSATSDPQIYLTSAVSAGQLMEWLDEASNGKALELPNRYLTNNEDRSVSRLPRRIYSGSTATPSIDSANG